MHLIAPITCRKGNNSAMKITNNIIIAYPQRRLFRDLPNRCNREAIVGNITTREALKDRILKKGKWCSLIVGQLPCPTSGDSRFTRHRPIYIEIAYEAVEVALGKMEMVTVKVAHPSV